MAHKQIMFQSEPRRAAQASKERRDRGPDHAAIVQMAAAEAASRAADRRETIATAAYFRAQRRGFEPGHEQEDWFAAEDEVAHAQQFDSY